MQKMVRFFAAIGSLAIAHTPEITDRPRHFPTHNAIKHLAPLTLALKGGIKVGVVQIPTGQDVQVEQRGSMTLVTTDPSNFGSDIHVMLGLCLSFQQVVVANEILDGANVVGERLGK